MSEQANLLYELKRIRGYLISIPSWVPGSVNAYDHIRDLIQTLEAAHPACAFCRGSGYITNPDDLKRVPCYCQSPPDWSYQSPEQIVNSGLAAALAVRADMIENLKSAQKDLRSFSYPATYAATIKIGWVLDALEGEDRERD